MNRPHVFGLFWALMVVSLGGTGCGRKPPQAPKVKLVEQFAELDNILTQMTQILKNLPDTFPTQLTDERAFAESQVTTAHQSLHKYMECYMSIWHEMSKGRSDNNGVTPELFKRHAESLKALRNEVERLEKKNAFARGRFREVETGLKRVMAG